MRRWERRGIGRDSSRPYKKPTLVSYGPPAVQGDVDSRKSGNDGYEVGVMERTGVSGMELAGQVAVVTGGGRGIGRATALALAGAGGRGLRLRPHGRGDRGGRG